MSMLPGFDQIPEATVEERAARKPVIIYVRGGDPSAPEIANCCDMAYGIRHDYVAYAPVYMLDIDFHQYEQLPTDQARRTFWRGYMDAVHEHNPYVAMAADYFDFPSSTALLNEQLGELKALAIPHVMVCPKFAGAVANIPDWCIVAVSIPAKSYAGFLPDYRHLIGRRVHLLGGRPEKQAEVMRKITGAGGTVVSIDGSYHAMKAGHGCWFNGGEWIQVRGNRELTRELVIASGRNIVRYLLRANEECQHLLF